MKCTRVVHPYNSLMRLMETRARVMQGRGDEAASAEVTCQQEAALEAEGVTREREARERGCQEHMMRVQWMGTLGWPTKMALGGGGSLHQGGWRRGGEWEAHEGEGLRLE
jgi:hypothetical protein